MKLYSAMFCMLLLTTLNGCYGLWGNRGCSSCGSCGAGYAPAPLFGGGGCPNGACGAGPIHGQPMIPPQGNLYSPMGNAPTAMTPVIPMTASVPADPLPTF